MPIRRIQKKVFRKTKKAYKRTFRRKHTNASIIINKSPSFLPDRYFTKLKYNELYAMAYGGVGVPAIYQWRMHGVYDPNLTGTGHQPYGHDQLQLIYNRYRVYGVKYKATFINQETAKHFDIAVLLRPNNTAPSVMETVLETPYVKKRVLGVEGSGQAVRTITGYCNNSKILGISRESHRSDDSNQQLFGATPTANGPILTTIVSNQNTGEVGTVNVRMELEYFIECFDRKVQTQS